MNSFFGARRRFDVYEDIYINKYKPIIIDDYGHHPTEINSTLDTINKLYPGKKIVMIFQPHRFSRTKAYWRLFRDVFKKLDRIILLPTYSAGEKNNSYDSSFMYQKLKNKNKLLLKSIDQVKDILKDFHPEVLRLFFLLTHYRSPISYSKEGLENAKRVLDKFYTLFSDIKTPRKFNEDKTFREEFISAFQDDFNSPKALSLLQAYAANTESGGDLSSDKLCTLKVLLNSLGLLLDEVENYFKYGELDLSDREIEKLISDRNDARGNKKFDLADEIRDQLLKKGIVLEDLDGKTIWKKKS